MTNDTWNFKDDYEGIEKEQAGKEMHDAKRLIVSVQMTKPEGKTKYTKAVFSEGILVWFQDKINTWSDGPLGIKTALGEERWSTDYDQLPEDMREQVKTLIPPNDRKYLHGFKNKKENRQ